MRSAGLLAAGAALAALVLSGCSDGGGAAEPTTTPTLTPTPTPTPAGPVEPTLPPEAAGEDAAAAEAFVRHYWAMVNYAQDTGDVTALRRLGSPSCTACQGGADGIVRIARAGGRTIGGAMEITRTTAKPFEAGPFRGFIVEVAADVAAQRVEIPGEPLKTYPGGPTELQVVVDLTDQGWQVSRWE